MQMAHNIMQKRNSIHQREFMSQKWWWWSLMPMLKHVRCKYQIVDGNLTFVSLNRLFISVLSCLLIKCVLQQTRTTLKLIFSEFRRRPLQIRKLVILPEYKASHVHFGSDNVKQISSLKFEPRRNQDTP